MSVNLQIIQLYGSLIQPDVIFLTWLITSGEDPLVNAYYIINYNGSMLISTSMNTRLPVNEMTTYDISVISVTTLGNHSAPSNSVQITTSSKSNILGTKSGLRSLHNNLSFQLNVERTCDNATPILPYPAFIDITKQPFYQYYKIQSNCR